MARKRAVLGIKSLLNIRLLTLALFLIQVAIAYLLLLQPNRGVTTPSSASNVTGANSAALQLAQGRKYYESGQFALAAQTWHQAVDVFATQGDSLNQSIVLSNLSLAYQQLGKLAQAKIASDHSIKLLQAKKANGNNQERLRVLGQALNTQGGLQLALGQSEQALATWQQAAATYEQAGDRLLSSRSLINQAQALKALGLYRRALATLTQVNKILQTQPDSLTKAAGLRSLGTTLQLIGDPEQSRQVLQKSLVLAQQLKSPPDISAALLGLGNTARTRGETKAALAYYEQAAIVATQSVTKVEAQLNQLSLILDQQHWSEAETLWSEIYSQLQDLPINRTTIYAQINFAQSLARLKQSDANSKLSWQEIASVVAQAVKQARGLNDQRALAYALGKLGRIYQQNQQLANAQDLTEQALLLAQAINAPDIAYNWQWQLGSLLKAQGDITGAIASYTEAVKTLQSLRSDLVAINLDVQFSFRESVEPVYRELVSLLLQPPYPGGIPSQENLAKAREAIESLQLAELDNFFKEACLDIKPIKLDAINAQSAVIYPIILADRLEVILSLPGQPLSHYAASIPQTEVESTINQFRQNLVIRSKREFMPFGQKLYDWLIRPAAADLAKSGVNTLVFVPDGALRNIPMAALNDGKNYLIEKYNIALAPSLQLLDPKPIPRKRLKALSVGLSEPRQGFAALSNVPQELKQINSEVPGVVLLNQKFTSSAFQKQIAATPFPIVHIATHGQFSSKAEQTFILSWDDRINVKQLDQILQPRETDKFGAIELLVLSACQTAAGDKRAALGLAGIAVRAGARSTLATLWSVDDAATAELMSQFYRELAKPNVTKALALRRAQLKLLKSPGDQHPIYWSPYVLVGNWL